MTPCFRVALSPELATCKEMTLGYDVVVLRCGTCVRRAGWTPAFLLYLRPSLDGSDSESAFSESVPKLRSSNNSSVLVGIG
jgi:hypothetical protein